MNIKGKVKNKIDIYIIILSIMYIIILAGSLLKTIHLLLLRKNISK